MNKDGTIGPDNRKGVESTWLRTCCQYPDFDGSDGLSHQDDAIMRKK